MKFAPVLLTLILSSNYFAQTYPVVSTLFMPQGYSINTLNGYGTSRLYNTPSNLNFINPASLNNFERISFGISYELQSRIKNGWIADIGGYSIKDYYPKSGGIVFPFSKLRLALAFGQAYNWQMDLGKIEVTTVEHPDGTGQYISPVYKTKLYNYSLLASLSESNIFADDKFSLGIRITENILTQYEEIWINTAEGDASTLNLSIGTVYKYNFNNDKYIETGISYETPVELKGKINMKGNELNHNGDTYRHIVQDFSLFGYVPGKICLDYNFNFINGLRILGTFNYNYWKSNFFNNYDDQLEIAGSFVFNLSSKMNASVGYYSTDFNIKKDDYYIRLNDKLKAFYITGGIIFNYDAYYIDLSIADSHILSDEGRKQTIAKFAVSLQI